MIKDVNFIPVNPKDGLIGFMSCLYNDMYLSGIAVKVKDNGVIYLICPSKKYKDKNLQYFYPINSQTYNDMFEALKPHINDFLESKNEGE